MKLKLSITLATLLVQLFLAGTAHSATDAQDTIIFSHKVHVVDAGAACTDCHQPTADNNGKSPTINHYKKACTGCHEDAIVTEKNCALCHSNPAKPQTIKIEITQKNFTHKAHLARNLECSACHKDVEKTGKVTAKNLPDMEMCFTCHNDIKARRDCNLCHTDLDKIKPTSHKSVRFLKEGHGNKARFDAAQCEKCHQQKTCDNCHSGQNSNKIHNPNYLVTHGLEAKRRDKNCMVCHEVNNSCIACHTRK